MVTKYRKKALSDKILERLEDHFRRICKNAEGELIEFNGEQDHVHLLISLPPKIAPARHVNTLKTISSREIRREFSEHLKEYYWKPILWSRSYCVVTTGGVPIEIIRRYIENQGK